MAEAGLVIFKLGCVLCNQLLLVFSTFVIEDGWGANSVCLKLPQGRFSSLEASVDQAFVLNTAILPRGNEQALLGVWSRDLLISKSRSGYGQGACCGPWLTPWSPDYLCRGSSFLLFRKEGRQDGSSVVWMECLLLHFQRNDLHPLPQIFSKTQPPPLQPLPPGNKENIINNYQIKNMILCAFSSCS